MSGASKELDKFVNDSVLSEAKEFKQVMQDVMTISYEMNKLTTCDYDHSKY